ADVVAAEARVQLAHDDRADHPALDLEAPGQLAPVMTAGLGEVGGDARCGGTPRGHGTLVSVPSRRSGRAWTQRSPVRQATRICWRPAGSVTTYSRQLRPLAAS